MDSQKLGATPYLTDTDCILEPESRNRALVVSRNKQEEMDAITPCKEQSSKTQR